MGKPKKKAHNCSPNAPRLDREERLLRRFYEPLILMDVLGSVRSEHDVSRSLSHLEVLQLPLNTVRRQFLRDLSYMCDYKKGGDTVTAIGLQHTPQCYIFWVAANTSPIEKIVPFLRQLLIRLQIVSRQEHPASNNDEEDSLVELCIDFASRRIRDYCSLLKPLFDACSRHLQRGEIDGADILSRFKKISDLRDNPIELCKFAYTTRRDACMQQITKMSTAPDYKTGADAIHIKFQLVRHYIGRLAFHIRGVKSLIASAPRLIHVLDDFHVQNIPTPPKAAGLPPVDGKTRLASIIVRQLPAKHQNLVLYQDALAQLDRAYGLTDRMLEKYGDSNHRPRVHAEVQVLEHFYEHSLTFEGGDRYIASSKPACYCCSLYFRHHPGRFVEPESHQKLYINWRPPGFDFPPESSRGKEHRHIIDAMTADIRKEVLHQIEEQRGPRTWHPDSVTGITESSQGRLSSQKFQGLETDLRKPGDASPSHLSAYLLSTVSTNQFTARQLYFPVESDDSDQEGGVLLNGESPTLATL